MPGNQILLSTNSLRRMFKIYKQTLHISRPPQTQRLNSIAYYRQEKTLSQRISSFLTIPAMIAGAILGILAFSVFFAMLLIPLSIVVFRAWRLLKEAKQQPDNQSIAAEYTVIDDEVSHTKDRG